MSESGPTSLCHMSLSTASSNNMEGHGWELYLGEEQPTGGSMRRGSTTSRGTTYLECLQKVSSVIAQYLHNATIVNDMTATCSIHNGNASDSVTEILPHFI